MSDIIIIRKAYSNKRHTALVLSALASPAFLDIFYSFTLTVETQTDNRVNMLIAIARILLLAPT